MTQDQIQQLITIFKDNGYMYAGAYQYLKNDIVCSIYFLLNRIDICPVQPSSMFSFNYIGKQIPINSNSDIEYVKELIKGKETYESIETVINRHEIAEMLERM